MDDDSFTSTISVRMPISMIKELDAVSKNSKFILPGVVKKFADRSEAIKSFISIGSFIDKNSGQIKDPKFVEELNQMIQNEKYMDWMDQLSEVQLKGLKDLINIKLEGKQTLLAG